MEDNSKLTGASTALQKEFEDSIKQEVQDCVKEVRAQKWQAFLHDKINAWTALINDLKISLPNGKNKMPYHTSVEIPPQKIFIKEAVLNNVHGLILDIADDKKGFSINGTPIAPEPSAIMEAMVTINFYHEDFPDIYLPPLKLKLTVNPDPKDLWRDLPVPADIEYPKKDAECEWINSTEKDGKTVIAASKRGRSHAHEGKPRDDHFSVNVTEDGWFVLIVADGAGSAPFSREGSRIACETANMQIVNQLKSKKDLLHKSILNFMTNDVQEKINKCRKALGDALYICLASAAYVVHQEIAQIARGKGREPKEYATTLLMAIAKKFNVNDSWFIGSFSIGDGAIGVYNHGDGTAKLLCEPDEGEYSGQTRFVTMNEVFNYVGNIYRRLRFHITKDFSSFMLMTDGVSDVFFETDANLRDAVCWEVLETNILHATNPEDNDSPSPETQAKRLLDWLDFWSTGNHDDRTIVILH